MVWIPAYAEKSLAKECAKRLIMRYKSTCSPTGGWCRIVKFSTEDSDIAIYKAKDLLVEFHIEPSTYDKADLDHPLLVHGEYLILYEIPPSSVLSVKTYVSLEERYTRMKVPQNLGTPEMWKSLRLECLPKTLYRIQVDDEESSRGLWDLGVHYRRSASGLWTSGSADDISDEQLWKSLRFHLNGSKDEVLWDQTQCIFVSTFSRMEDAAEFVRDYRSRERRNFRDRLRLVTIDISRADLAVFNAAALVSNLQVPLKSDLQLPDLEHEYLVLQSIPGEAIIVTHNINDGMERERKGCRAHVELYRMSLRDVCFNLHNAVWIGENLNLALSNGVRETSP